MNGVTPRRARLGCRIAWMHHTQHRENGRGDIMNARTKE
jgi:hypothetical protein